MHIFLFSNSSVHICSIQKWHALLVFILLYKLLRPLLSHYICSNNNALDTKQYETFVKASQTFWGAASHSDTIYAVYEYRGGKRSILSFL